MSAYDPLFMGADYGVLTTIKKSGEQITHARVEQLTNLAKTKKKRWSNYEIDALREIVRPYLMEVHYNMKVRTRLGIPFFDWHTLEQFYELKYNLSLAEDSPFLSREQLALSKAEELFQLGIPEYRPKSAKHLMTILNDKRIMAVRRRIEGAAERKEPLDDVALRLIWRGLGTCSTTRVATAQMDNMGASVFLDFPASRRSSCARIRRRR